ncbi:MAG: thiamine pyrophosphate-dependent dehydrogenase E1 component subunit alpha [Anaerolineaceae bacterium]|nr:thiamine pyrophosphate-dependent dehydrogenase E1 component subunit alpha [Anaerolineaceae bacterium]
MESSSDTKNEMFRTMLLARRLDERAWVLHRQGKIAFHISGIGHEAAQVGAAYAIRRGYDWVAPYYRDLALMLSLGFSGRDFMLGLLGKQADPNSGGRQMPSHWSMKKANVISQSAAVATQSLHAVGIALAIKMRKEDRVVLTSAGEGATSQGEWYEAVNWAAVQHLPVVFLVENNQYAISERQEKQMAVKSVADKASGLGLRGVSVDGSDAFVVQAALNQAVESARQGQGPALVEARLYRMTPHSSDDDDRTYRSRQEVENSKKRDPILITRLALEKAGLLMPQKLDELEASIKEEVEEAVKFAEQSPDPDRQDGLGPVYAEQVRRG